MLWTPQEVLRLIKVLNREGEILTEQAFDCYAVAGGVPRLILQHNAAQLMAIVRQRVRSITPCMVCTVIEGLRHTGCSTGCDWLNLDDLLHTGMFAASLTKAGEMQVCDTRASKARMVAHDALLVCRCGSSPHSLLTRSSRTLRRRRLRVSART